MNKEKVHLYKRVESAWSAYNDRVVDMETATHQTVCGYVRNRVARDKKRVTCKKCLKAINNA